MIAVAKFLQWLAFLLARTPGQARTRPGQSGAGPETQHPDRHGQPPLGVSCPVRAVRPATTGPGPQFQFLRKGRSEELAFHASAVIRHG